MAEGEAPEIPSIRRIECACYEMEDRSGGDGKEPRESKGGAQ